MNRRTKKIACVIAIVIFIAAGLCVLCLSRTSGFYTEKQHIARVRKRAKKHFLGEGSEYTGLEVYPLYTENEELKYMLIELQPQGYMYVIIRDIDLSWIGGCSMYTMQGHKPHSWMPYRVKEGARERVEDDDGYFGIAEDMEFFRDENGEPFRYFESHFKVAGVENERRYFLATPVRAESSSTAMIPAVKRGEQYLDLVNGELIDYVPGVYSAFATASGGFTAHRYFNL